MSLACLLAVHVLAGAIPHVPPPTTPPSQPSPPSASTNLPAMKRLADGVFQIGEVTFDKANRTASFPGFLNMEAGLVEYALVGSTGKIHESLLRTDIEPIHLHTAMLLLGTKDRTPRLAPGQVPPPPSGDDVVLSFEWTLDGRKHTRRVEDCIKNTQTGKVMSRGPWIYNGSRLVEGQFMAQSVRSFISVMEDTDALINNPRPGHEDDKIWIVDQSAAPPANTSVTITIQLVPASLPNATRPGKLAP